MNMYIIIESVSVQYPCSAVFCCCAIVVWLSCWQHFLFKKTIFDKQMIKPVLFSPSSSLSSIFYQKSTRFTSTLSSNFILRKMPSEKVVQKLTFFEDVASELRQKHLLLIYTRPQLWLTMNRSFSATKRCCQNTNAVVVTKYNDPRT